MTTKVIETLRSLDPARGGPVNHLPITHVSSKKHTDQRFAHVIRRLFHFSACAVSPLLFYFGWIPYFEESAVALSPWLETRNILLGMSLLAVGWDVGVRLLLKGNHLNWGQREYERRQISAQVQAGVGIFLTFLLAPQCFADESPAECSNSRRARFGTPVIWTLAIMDPLIGVVKEYRWSAPTRLLMASLFAFGAWGIAVLSLGTPFWLGVLLAPIAALVELPSFPHLDDNLLIPLSQTLLVRLALEGHWGVLWGGKLGHTDL